MIATNEAQEIQFPQNDKILDQVIDSIRHERKEHLQDPYYLEYKLLPKLGLSDRLIQHYPDHLHQYCGTGVDSLQYPNQFSKYLAHLATKKIKSYAEIGCYKGGAFIIACEYLSRFHELEMCIACDPWPRYIMMQYAERRPNVVYITDSSHNPKFKDLYLSRKWDMTFIDGNQSYQSVVQDYNMVSSNTKMFAVNNIKNVFYPGPQQCWDEIKTLHKKDQLIEWTDQYDDVLLRMRGSVMGIGFVEHSG